MENRFIRKSSEIPQGLAFSNGGTKVICSVDLKTQEVTMIENIDDIDPVPGDRHRNCRREGNVPLIKHQIRRNRKGACEGGR